ncbi:hypothetical protein [Streptomyces sp. TRM49041]|uniref:hypothetical protein n=1 Tax=Streptomyces sp. TRM49041 TaxID=2603216 RepID=UPI0011EC3AFC|nr:hypothetical protein [Streptomyces sp. TRM49041]
MRAVPAALLAASPLIVRDVDRRFGGMTDAPASAMADTERDITADFTSVHGEVRLPFDAERRELPGP